MIANLNKNYETIEYRENSHIRLYNNAVCEHYPPHWHNDIEIINVRSGKLHVHCQASDYYLNAGDVLFICPAAIHEIFEETEGLRFYIQANMTCFSFLTELDTAFSMMNPAALITPDTFPDIYGFISEQITKIHHTYFEDAAFKPSTSLSLENQQNQDLADTSLPFMAETQIYTYLLSSIVSISCEYQKSIVDEENPAHITSSRNHNAMKDTCRYIAEHFAEPISLESVAAYSGFSKYHFERIFKQFTNMTFYQYLTKVRLSYAQQLLGDHSIPVTEIALRSGFSGGSSFTRAFRQATGFTPSDFRQINEQIHPLDNDVKFRYIMSRNASSGDSHAEHLRPDGNSLKTDV